VVRPALPTLGGCCQLASTRSARGRADYQATPPGRRTPGLAAKLVMVDGSAGIGNPLALLWLMSQRTVIR